MRYSTLMFQPNAGACKCHRSFSHDGHSNRYPRNKSSSRISPTLNPALAPAMMSAAHAPPGMRQAHRSELKRRLLWLPPINAARCGLQRLAQCLNFKLKLAHAEAGWRVRRSRRRRRLVGPWDFRRTAGPETYRPGNSVLVWLTVAEMLSKLFLICSS
jgi:hypothetical protein